MSTEYYPATSLIGGGDGALDKISAATLGDGDIALVATSTEFYVYRYDSSSSADEDSPDIIKPDDVGNGGRWLLVFNSTHYHAGDTLQPDKINLVDGQIAFPATAVPSADPNTLDEYEEGEFEVTLTSQGGGSGVNSITIDAAFDKMAYVKVGKKVWVGGELQISAIDAPTGYVLVNGLPFTSATSTEGSDRTSGSCDVRYSAVIFGGSYGVVEAGVTYIRLVESGLTTTGYSLAQRLDAGSIINIGMTYVADN